MTAIIKFHGYSDEEEVDVARLQKVEVKGKNNASECFAILIS